MDSYKTHSIFPDSQKSTYGNNGIENIDFTLLIPEGRAYVPNTLRVTGFVEFTSNGVQSFEGGENVYYDSKIGMHSLFRSMYLSDDMGTNSNIDEYPTWVKQLMLRSTDLQDYCGSAKRELELCTPTDKNTSHLIFYVLPFSICPQIGLNLMDATQGGITNRRGKILLTVTTNNAVSVLYGTLNDAGTQPVSSSSTFSISDLKLSYDTRLTQPQDNQASMMSVFHARHTASTSADVFNINLPLVASAFVASYKPIDNVNNPLTPEYVMVNPDISRLEITYNNSTNEVLSFPFKENQEILLNSLNALELSNKTPSTVFDTLSSAAQQYTIGLNFGEPLDLKKARLSVRTESSNITNQNRHFMDLYAVGLLSL